MFNFQKPYIRVEIDKCNFQKQYIRMEIDMFNFQKQYIYIIYNNISI